MITFIAASCAGIVSSVMTLVIGQPPQHYFWRRQGHAERQLAIIDQLNTLAAELRFLLLRKPEDIDGRRERLFMTLTTAMASVRGLFSSRANQGFMALEGAMLSVLLQANRGDARGCDHIDSNLHAAHHKALRVQEAGFPALSQRQWLRGHARHPLRAQVWDRPQQYWRERVRPKLQKRWVALSVTHVILPSLVAFITAFFIQPWATQC
jgi:hypothetical protein